MCNDNSEGASMYTAHIVTSDGSEPPKEVLESAKALAAVIMLMLNQKDVHGRKPVKAYPVRNKYVKRELDDVSRAAIERGQPCIPRVREYMLSMGAGYELDVISYSFLSVEEIYFANMVFRNTILKRDVIVNFTGNSETFPDDIKDMQWFLPWYSCSADNNYKNPAIGILICNDMSVKPGVAYIFPDREDPLNSPGYRSEEELPEEFRTVLPGVEKLLSLSEPLILRADGPEF